MAMKGKDDGNDREKTNLAKYNNLLQKHKQLINEKMIFTNFLEREWSILSSKYPSTFERGLMNYPYKVCLIKLIRFLN